METIDLKFDEDESMDEVPNNEVRYVGESTLCVPEVTKIRDDAREKSGMEVQKSTRKRGRPMMAKDDLDNERKRAMKVYKERSMRKARQHLNQNKWLPTDGYHGGLLS